MVKKILSQFFDSVCSFADTFWLITMQSEKFKGVDRELIEDIGSSIMPARPQLHYDVH